MQVEHSDQIEFAKLADIALAGTHNGLSARLNQLQFKWLTEGIHAEGTFCYLTFKDGQPTQDEFAEFIYKKIIEFCLPRTYIRECRQKLTDTGDTRWFFEPVDKAKALFIKAKEKNSKSGEPGEVVLFTLLEGILGAPKIVSKMYLKTNANMEVYGSDAIHIKYDPENEILNVYWGESKLYQELPKALTSILESVKNFRSYNEKIAGIQRDFDINIIRNHPDIDCPDAQKTREALAAFLDPYNHQYNNIKEIHACLAICDTDLYKQLSGTPEVIEQTFKSKYLEEIQSACDLFIKKIMSNKLEHLRFHFFLLPVNDTADFRKRFCLKVGLPYDKPPKMTKKTNP